MSLGSRSDYVGGHVLVTEANGFFVVSEAAGDILSLPQKL